MKIVVVDDDKIIRMGLKKLIERLFDCHEVIANYQNGELAYNYLKDNEGTVDLVITDIKMPVMTGTELIKKSIEEIKNPPIFVVLSGYDEFTYVRDAMKFGAFNYLLKPIKNAELKSMIEEVEKEVVKIKKQNKVYNDSVEILKKDFFKKLLFSSQSINSKRESDILCGIQLDEDYIYRMIVVENCEKSVYSKFIKTTLESNKGLEYAVFSYKEKIYIVLYIRSKENVILEEIERTIEKNIKIFSENNINTFMFEKVNEVYKLHEQSALLKKIDKNVFEKNAGKVYVLNNSNKIKDISNEDEKDTSSTVIKLAKEYIIKNYNNNITLKDVAEEVYLSQNYLSELFKKETGNGFYDFLSRYRIKKAKELLITTNIKIYEIAQKVGYNDSITFGRAFKKITGVSPNAFRNNDE